jgi:hypothetical protein
MILTGKNRSTGRKDLSQCHFVHHKIPHRQTSALRGRGASVSHVLFQLTTLQLGGHLTESIVVIRLYPRTPVFRGCDSASLGSDVSKKVRLRLQGFNNIKCENSRSVHFTHTQKQPPEL